MPAPAQNSRVLRFGVFEADLQEFQLRRDGLRIRLQEQPFQILSILLDHPGETVTREELRRRLWPADTFVDFDHSLNSSIKKLREALGDDSENPRFIETLHRRGYRFIAPVSGRAPVLQLVRPSEPLPRTRNYALWIGMAAALILAASSWLARSPAPPRVMNATQLTNDGRSKHAANFSTPLVTDGSRVYFEEENSGAVIAHVSVSGGGTALMNNEFPAPKLMDISHTTSELLVGGNRQDAEPPIEAFPLGVGSRRRLGALTGHDAGWSQDGRRIVVIKAGDLYVARSDGGDLRKIATVGDAFWLRWSPDGNRIRFTRWDGKTGARSLWEINADGSSLHPVLPGWNNPPDECCGNWTRGGKFFFFQATREGRTDIWALPEARSFPAISAPAPIQLTSGALSYFAPVASPDGKQIFVKGAIPRWELVRHDASTGRFLSYLGGISADGLDFSKDGNWATYVAYPEGTLWRSKVDGSQRLQLTFPPMRVFLPRWSPDGKRIAFAGATPGRRWRIFLISAEGGQPEQMSNGEGDELDVGWSGDGKSLVFGPMPPSITRPIKILDLGSGQISNLPGSEGLFSPRCSPDGRYIVAIPLQFKKLMLYDFHTKKWMERKTAYVGFPTWSRDGKYVYFDSPPPTGPAFFRLRISDGKTEQVASLKDVHFASSDFGNWTGLAPDDSPLVLRDAGSQEIYALDWREP